MSCGVGHRWNLDLALLWLRPVATALIQPLAWETPYAAGAALKKKKERKKETLVCNLNLVSKKTFKRLED